MLETRQTNPSLVAMLCDRATTERGAMLMDAAPGVVNIGFGGRDNANNPYGYSPSKRHLGGSNFLFVEGKGWQDAIMPVAAWLAKSEQQEDAATWVPKMLGFIQKNKLNWTGFSFHPGASPIMITGWDFTPSPEWGAPAKRALAGEQFPYLGMR